jgi:hypothetical protein
MSSLEVFEKEDTDKVAFRLSARNHRTGLSC